MVETNSKPLQQNWINGVKIEVALLLVLSYISFFPYRHPNVIHS